MNRKIKGITLTEVLFSAIIVALVIAGTLVIFVQTVEISKKIDYEYITTNLAKSRVERIRASLKTSGFDSLTEGNFGETDTMIDIDSDGIDDFKRSTTVAVNYAGNSRLTKVDVEIIYKYRSVWKEGAAITMTTVFTDVEQ